MIGATIWPMFSCSRTRPLLLWTALAVLLSANPSHAAADRSLPFPWEVWRDLRTLAVIQPADQVLLRSSHCLTGCGSDKQAPGDPRVIRWIGDEAVIFDEAGPGAVTRIWMTSGETVSAPLDPAAQIRFYFDGEPAPRLDLSLPDLFSGAAPPFTPPLVGDRLASSGGYFSYVPIPFRQSLVVTLSGAASLRLWFQFGFHRLAADQQTPTYTGGEDLCEWRALVAARGADPWPAAATGLSFAGEVVLGSGDAAIIYSGTGPRLLTHFALSMPATAWPTTEVEMRFDGATTVRLPAADLFGAGEDAGNATRSLLVGASADGMLYSYFPMPFQTSAAILLRSSAPAGSGAILVSYEIRQHAELPLPASGTFGATLTVADPAPTGSDLPFLVLDRPGKWVGLAAQLSSVATLSRKYLEGDERIYLDGSRHPGLYGTGAEDLFNGGFYFDQDEFGGALHGMTDHEVSAGEDRVSAYRLLLTDAVTFAAGVRAGLEPGTTGNVPFRGRIVAWHYTAAWPPIERVDRLDMGSPASRIAHQYESLQPVTPVNVNGFFEGEPPVALAAAGLARPADSSASFQLDGRRCAGALRLRRLVDVVAGGQAAALEVAGQPDGAFAYREPNPDRRLREEDLDLSSGPGLLELRVVGQPVSGGDPPLTELAYELWCQPLLLPLFADGFESGDTSAWNLEAPSPDETIASNGTTHGQVVE